MRLILLIFTWACLAQAQIIDVSTGSRCTATFLPATSATDVQIDCTYQSKPVLSGAKVNLVAITGNTSGFVVGFSTGSDSVTILLKRASPTGPLHVEAAVNGAQTVNKDIPVL